MVFRLNPLTFGESLGDILLLALWVLSLRGCCCLWPPNRDVQEVLNDTGLADDSLEEALEMSGQECFLDLAEFRRKKWGLVVNSRFCWGCWLDVVTVVVVDEDGGVDDVDASDEVFPPESLRLHSQGHRPVPFPDLLFQLFLWGTAPLAPPLCSPAPKGVHSLKSVVEDPLWGTLGCLRFDTFSAEIINYFF